MRIEVGVASIDELIAFYVKPLEYVALRVDGAPVAIGGFVRGEDGRLWSFFDAKPDLSPAVGRAAILAIRRHLVALKEDVYVQCHAEKFPATAERLVKLLGFRPTDHTINGHRTWICQA